ncbi:hypothetical protein B0T19DRAFT_476203 [Cercophora scortea]|uniref:Uncharacterized protein n=1 Tax=Cercophora scortea TaxID=314031 RepID=A0AAE0IPA3_9PEZI|nr:hypothetical protein B0T19DRAFT_476203 [Cercophora scortea]
MDIVWSCLSILLLCTWSIIHLNVPEQTTPRNKREKFMRNCLRLWNKMKWMLFNLLAPEWALGMAVADYRTVSAVEAGFNKMKEKDDVPWTRSHIYLANMGGFTIVFDTQTPSGSQSAEESSGAQTGGYGNSRSQGAADLDLEIRAYLHVWERARNHEVNRHASSRTSQYFGAMNRKVDEMNWSLVSEALREVNLRHFKDSKESRYFLEFYREWAIELTELQFDRWVLDGSQLLLARQLGVITKLPTILEDDVSDKNKGDLFVKVVAVSQIAWFVLQLIVRLVSRIPTSQLEIMTLSFAISTGLTYFWLVEKPKDVQCSIIVPAARYATPREVMRIALAGPMDWSGPGR